DLPAAVPQRARARDEGSPPAGVRRLAVHGRVRDSAAGRHLQSPSDTRHVSSAEFQRLYGRTIEAHARYAIRQRPGVRPETAGEHAFATGYRCKLLVAGYRHWQA